jgi:hypothetical protein
MSAATPPHSSVIKILLLNEPPDPNASVEPER